MTYSLALKEELISMAPHKACCKQAYLRGLFLNAAQTKSGNVVLSVSAAAARLEIARVYRDFSKKEALFSGRTLLFSDATLLSLLKSGVPRFSCRHCADAYLRGALIAAGSVTDPEKAYHLELRVEDRENLDFLLSFFTERGWQPKQRAHRDGILLYFKNSTAIEELLTFMGANNALFTLMNAKITRDIRNAENRATNCVAKNISQSVQARNKVLEAVTALRETARFEAMPEEWRETARLRECYPEASLAELAALHNPPLTKSGLSHRLQKILAFATGEKSK